ncbi:MAG: hypothetical protein HY565_00635 [Candidatus Kerfeldbacteria bacterium]|nr:hypothetical protein [Candidatus Kerfeldbacteria bacterium]
METLSDRKQALLKGIIEEYTSGAKPVGSQWLVEKLGLDLSSATIRNEMKELEEHGLIAQPHTSAGRIPTEDGYRFYIEHFLQPKAELDQTSQQELQQLSQVLTDQGPEGIVKNVMKGVATKSDEAILISLNRYSYYYTGISNLFRKPEFQNMNEVLVFSHLIDQLDEVMAKLHNAEPDDDITFFVGSDNPVSQYCSALVTQYQIGPNVAGTVALLGPMRMDYQYNYNLLKYSKSLLRDMVTSNV